MGVIARAVEDALKRKSRLADMLRARLDDREAREAREDHHARRKPRPCGMTIHTGIGCNVGCLYCYVPDMGFPLKPRPYPLSGLQLAYALAVNPYFIPGPKGTLLAFGSVTEPFLPETLERTLEYLKATRDILGNPQQLSTKLTLDERDVDRLVNALEPRANILLTVTTVKYASILEPRAPPVEERFEFASRLVKRGVMVTLFLRPIIPGVTDRELDTIYAMAVQAGIKTVVPGSLRVTPGIIRRLKASGVVDVSEILRRLPRKPRSGRDQVTIVENDLKKIAIAKAREYGLEVLPSSCSANIVSHGLACYACKWGPCGDPSKLPPVEEEDVREALEVLGCKPLEVKVRSNLILARCRGDAEKASVWLETIAKRRVHIVR
jgi:DNA repair photolyase